MIGPRIFVGFAEEVPRDRLFAQQLVDDLYGAGNDVALLTSNEKALADDAFVQMLNQQLAACEYVLFVLTPEALHSTKVQMIVNTALNLVVRQRIRNIFALLAAPIDAQDMPPTWTTIRVFDATQDYPRALARVQLALTPITAATTVPTPFHATLQEATQPVLTPLLDRSPISLAPTRLPQRGQQRFRIWSVPLVLVCVLGLVIGLITYTTYAIPKKPSLRITTPGSTLAKTTTIVPTLSPTAAAFPNTPQGLYASVMQSTPLIADPLNQANGNNWDVTLNNTGSCQFLNGAYDVTSAEVGYRQLCVMKNNSFQNFALQSQMSFVSGPGPCGFVTRMQGHTVGLSYRLYYFANGDYEFLGSEDVSGNNTTLIKRTSSHASTQIVTLTQIAKNATLYIYINGRFIAEAKDATFASGAIGFICKDTPTPTEARFTNAKIWKL